MRSDWQWLDLPPHPLSSPGWVLIPLRLFLGVTFCVAGLQKLANPGFFDATNPVSIQSQLAGAARRSPVHDLVAPLVHVAVPLGLLISFGEIAVGLGALLGLWTRVAAAGGLVLSLMLFLTISFHASPYYTGSDIVFLFAWTPLVLAGAGGALSIDALKADADRRRAGQDATRPAAAEMDRRTFAAWGATAATAAIVTLVGGGLAAGMGRLFGTASAKPGPLAIGGTADTTTATRPAPSTPTPALVPPSGGTVPSSTTTRPRPAGTAIGAASQVPVGGAGSFSDPNTGDPSLVIQPQKGSFVAFDLVCPHAGCVVQYDTSSKELICPCHGSRFNSNTGAVEVGPAVSGLLKIRIAEGSDGQLYVT